MEKFSKINWGMLGVLITAIGIAVTAIAFIVNLRADLNHHINDHKDYESRISKMEQNLNQLEEKMKNCPAPPKPSCSTAKIVGLPDKSLEVDRTEKINWTPTNCKMVVQVYQNGVLINEFDKIPKLSGEVTIGEAATDSNQGRIHGMIELKIWIPGEEKPVQEGVWVKVR